MASKGSFENHYEDYSTETAHNVLNDTFDGVGTYVNNDLHHIYFQSLW